ncbi:hypothetical protein ACRS1R_01880 [Aeromonas dhakensis]|uniref:hypothetical protein n=1 Tax=Aeromonas dhakensis TaxID=196024 RepID=UPI0038D09327
METNRWWEFYFIRYFVGSVLGSLVVMALAFHPDSLLRNVIFDLLDFKTANSLTFKSEHFLVIFSFGIAFCYVSSAPILVMHACRAHFDFQSHTNNSIKYWTIRVIILLVPLLVAFLLFHSEDNKINRIPFFYTYMLTVLLQLVLIYPVINTKFNTIFEFYKSLSKDRAKESQDRKQFIESYKHLREHGNAFLILFCELVLGGALFSSDSLSGALIVLIFWLSPTIPIWLLGTFLESKIKNI